MSMDNMSISGDIIAMILAGDLDDDLAEVTRACYTRQAVIKGGLKNGEKREFQRGQKVRIAGTNLRPKYMIGKEFTVKRVNQKTVVVDMPKDSGYGRFSGASNVRIPKNCVTMVS